jgi:MazG family protein
MDQKKSLSEAFLKLVTIMDELREQCPWDKKQTIQSLRPLTIEELYELADSNIDEDRKGIKEELGDLLLHILFYARIGSEQKEFSLQEVIEGISAKLVSRHPHIYGNVVVNNEEDVKQNWEKLKLKEGKTSVLSGVPLSLPAVVKATRLQEKAKQVGFEWENKDQVLDKVKEEMDELQAAIKKESQSEIENELGDVFFSLINYARFLQVDAESALEKTNKKFIRRFTEMEQYAREEGKQLADLSLEEMDAIWNAIKKQTHGH